LPSWIRYICADLCEQQTELHNYGFSNLGVLLHLKMSVGAEVEVIVTVMAAAPVAMMMKTWMKM
jgi:hypothetical protein